MWTPLLARDGHTRVVNSFLRGYSKLEYPLTSSEAMFVVQLMSYKWDEAAPYPSLQTLAKRMGMSSTAVRKIARKLENKGYLHRLFRTGDTNVFNLTPLFQALEGVLVAAS